MSRIIIGDFSGGLTDSKYTSPENCAVVTQNIIINKDKSARTAPGIDIISTVAYRVGTSTRVSKKVKYGDDIIAFSGKKAYLVTSSAVTEILGPTGNSAFNLGDADSIVSVETYNNHFIATNDAYSYPIKLWKDGSNVWNLVTAGLPQVASDPTITSAAGANSYIYAFVHYFEYTVGTTIFRDYGPPRYVSKGSLNNNISITNIPALSNGADYNYDTTNIKVQIYRTVNNGTSFYYVDEVTNGTTTYTDTTTDANLILNETLYTNGGVQPNDPPPPSRYLFEANDTFYYVDVQQGGETKGFRVLQAVTNDPDSVPEGNLTDYKGTCKGGGAIGRAAIVFTEDGTFRQDGIIDELGRGVVTKGTLSSTVGCIAHNSIIKTSRGLYFASKNGFYFTDGNGAPTKLAKKDAFSSKIDNIYKELVVTDEQKSRIQGAYDAINGRVFWTVQQASSDNDVIFVYDETHDAFTTISNSVGISPTSLLMDGEDLLLGDSQGYLFRMSDDYYTHPVVDTSIAPASWIEDTVIYRWKSVAISMGDGSLNKWLTKINVQGTPETNLTMAILSYTNGEDEYKELYPLRLSPLLTWGDLSFTWGEASFVWDRTSTMNQTRRFAAGRLRARHRQIEFTNAYFEILASTDAAGSKVTVNSAAKTATLVSPSDFTFGLNNELYTMTIDGVEYDITSGTVDTLTLSDPDNTLVNGTYAWSISGYGKGQRAHIMNFTLEFQVLSDQGTNWRPSASA